MRDCVGGTPLSRPTQYSYFDVYTRFEPVQESTDSARKAVEKLQADGKLVQMAKVIATVNKKQKYGDFSYPPSSNVIDENLLRVRVRKKYCFRFFSRIFLEFF